MYIDSCSVVGNASDGNFGGGLLSLDGNLFVTNSEFRANSTPGRGGAIWATNNSVVEGKILDARNSSFTENQGTVLGAAIYTQNPFNMTVDSCEVSVNGNNTASGRGAICMLQDFGNTGIKQDVIITNSEFFNNETTAEGAALYIQNPTNGTTIDISDTDFTGNVGPSIGGAMFFRPGNTSTFDNVTGFLNQADDGGFIWALEEQNPDSLNIPDASLTIMNSNLGYNFAQTQGGAVNAAGGIDFTSVNTVYQGNLILGEEGGSGGAIICNGDTTGQTVLLVNNTFGGNGAVAFADDVAFFVAEGVPAENNTDATLINNAFASDQGLGNVAIEAVDGAGIPNITSGGGNFFFQEPTDFTADDADIVDGDIDPLSLFTDFDPGDTEFGNDLSINCDLADNPLVDAGVTGDDVPATDITGADRDATPDIGAYEKVVELPSIVEIVVESDVHNTLETLLGDAGLVDDLSGDGPFTVFAPTDAAFALLTAEENMAIQDAENGLVNTLLTHVTTGAVFSTDITDGMSVPSLAMGTNLDFGVAGSTVTVSTPQSAVATVIDADIEASNGVVHVIDVVLIPAIVAVNDIDGAGFDVEFFPNPVQDRMNVRINDLRIEDMNVSVVNMAGQRLNNQVLTNGNNIIEFTRLPAGTYTLEINIDGNVYSKQIVKQ